MSSRVHLPDDSPPATPVAWRQVRTAGGDDPRELVGELQRDFESRAATLEQQFERQVREARAAGIREGEAAGHSRAAAELQPVLERLARSIDEIGQMRARLRRDAESDLVRLSLAIARRVLRRELAIDPEALHGLVLASLEKLQLQEISRVRVHPSHAAPVAAALPKSFTGSPIEVIADPSCEPGGVIFETTRGNLDASVETQLQEIERGLADRLRKAQ